MADSPLIVKSKAFALEVIRVCKELQVAKCENEVCYRTGQSEDCKSGRCF